MIGCETIATYPGLKNVQFHLLNDAIKCRTNLDAGRGLVDCGRILQRKMNG